MGSAAKALETINIMAATANMIFLNDMLVLLVITHSGQVSVGQTPYRLHRPVLRVATIFQYTLKEPTSATLKENDLVSFFHQQYCAKVFYPV